MKAEKLHTSKIFEEQCKFIFNKKNNGLEISFKNADEFIFSTSGEYLEFEGKHKQKEDSEEKTSSSDSENESKSSTKDTSSTTENSSTPPAGNTLSDNAQKGFITLIVENVGEMLLDLITKLAYLSVEPQTERQKHEEEMAGMEENTQISVADWLLSNYATEKPEVYSNSSDAQYQEDTASIAKTFISDPIEMKMPGEFGQAMLEI